MLSNFDLCRPQERYSSFLAPYQGRMMHQGLLWIVYHMKQGVLRDPLKIREKTQIAKFWSVFLQGVQLSQTFPGNLGKGYRML